MSGLSSRNVASGSLSVRPAGVLCPFQLNLQSLGADLKAVHRLDRLLCRGGVVEADKSETFTCERSGEFWF